MNSIDFKQKYIKYKNKYLLEKSKYLEKINGGAFGFGAAAAPRPGPGKRLSKEIEKLKETFRGAIITENGNIISVRYRDSTFTIELPLPGSMLNQPGWPFTSPIFRINGQLQKIPTLIDETGRIYNWGPSRTIEYILLKIIEYQTSPNPEETVEKWEKEKEDRKKVAQSEHNKKMEERRKKVENYNKRKEYEERQKRENDIVKFNRYGMLPKGERRLQVEIKKLEERFGKDNVQRNLNNIFITHPQVNYTIIYSIDFPFGEITFRNNNTGEQYTGKLLTGGSLLNLIR
jgi:ubiquitin-protein ligase